VSKPIASSNISVFASDEQLPESAYTLVYDQDAVLAQQPRMVYLRSKWRSTQDFFEISYNTVKGYCSKCLGLNKLDDVSFNIKGGLLVTREEPLLLQNLEKFTVTEFQSNPFHSFIGTHLTRQLGQKIINQEFTKSQVVGDISTSLNSFKSLQSQYRQTGRSVTNGELLDTVVNITVEFDPADPTILRATVSAKALSGKVVKYTQYMKARG
jgi:hypothetical protein